MINKLKAAYAAHLKASADMTASANALADAANSQTTTIRQSQLKNVAIAAMCHDLLDSLDKSMRYLVAAEKHRRREAGIRDEF
jgi:hypothetical protein